jgi:type II secretory pathway component PulK
MTRPADQGVVLVTILIVMALCVTVIVAMTTRSEQATRATGQGLAAAQAHALLAAGEESALSALALDLRTAPLFDGPGEPWARVAQQDTTLSLGQFNLQIWDEAARFNLNALTDSTPAARQVLADIVAAAALPPEVAARIAAALAGGRMLLQTGDLAARAGLSAGEIAALQPLVTCNPVIDRPINVNTAPEPVLSAALRNPALTQRLLDRRATDLLTPAVMREMGVILPSGLTLRSDFFGLRAEATVGAVTVRSAALLHRWTDRDGTPHVVIAGRRLGPTDPRL